MAPPVARRAPYKDFLQPALQRRFAGTAAILVGLSYFESLTLSNWNSLIWSWFPLGPTGLRAMAIFICVLPIIILRIAHSHMGIRTSNSPFEALTNIFLPFSTLETVVTYIISSLIFSQVYLKSTSEDAGIRWISYATGRSRLNEHAVFYTVNFLVLGLVQGLGHVAYDQNRLVLGALKSRPDEKEGTDANVAPTPPEHWSTQLGRWTPILAVRCGVLAISVAMFNYVVLYSLVRASAWRTSMWFFRFIYGDLPKYNFPPGNAPWSVWMLGRTIWASFLLGLLWQFADIAFRVQLTREPLKHEQPLTMESKDPNGSLLNGLQSKKPRIFAFAMWELALISRNFTARRQSIFEDIDRKDGPTWSQIYVSCLDTIRDIERKIDHYQNPPAPAPPATKPAAGAPPQPQERISQPIRTNDVSAARRPDKTKLITGTVLKVVTSPGKTPIEDFAPFVRKHAVKAADAVMTREQKEAFQPQALRGRMHTLALRVLALPFVGPLFLQTFDRQLAKAVLGSPYAESSVYINAAYALSRLAVCSLAEDKYGNVQRDVASIIRTFTLVIRRLESFKDGFPSHWTDLKMGRDAPDVDEVLGALKVGLGALVEQFAPYATDLRLSRADMRLAREAAVVKEVEQEQEQEQGGRVREAEGRGVRDAEGRAGVRERQRERQPEMQQVS
ncbi:nucleoporin protein Ndc1-Nup [Astrocystis sublimbata]|nr:nucleoporin protein Ndc1-Nup [Astrocystis sublimbata]